MPVVGTPVTPTPVIPSASAPAPPIVVDLTGSNATPYSVKLAALARHDGLSMAYAQGGVPFTLPADFDAADAPVYTFSFDEPEPGLRYDYTAVARWGSATGPTTTYAGTTAGTADPTTDWGSWSGMKSIGGAIDGAIASNLDNLSTAADLVRVQADLSDATAEAKAWAEGNGYAVADVTALMASDPNTGRRVRRAVNTLAFAYLIQHRQWFDVSSLATDTQKALAGMESRAEKMLTALFGAKPEGIAGLTPDDETPDPGEWSFVAVQRDGEDTTVTDEFSSN